MGAIQQVTIMLELEHKDITCSKGPQSLRTDSCFLIFILFDKFIPFHFPGCSMITKSDMDKHLVPSLEDLGKESKDCGPNLFPGGETEALDRMERMLKKTVRK